VISTTFGKINPRHIVQIIRSSRPGVHGVDIFVIGFESAIFVKTDSLTATIDLQKEVEVEVDASNRLELKITTKIGDLTL